MAGPEALTITPEAAASATAEAIPQVIIKEVKLSPLLLNVSLNKLYARPDKRSKVVFEIPFDFRIVATTPGERWVKIRAEYDFLGRHVVEGWGQVRE